MARPLTSPHHGLTEDRNRPFHVATLAVVASMAVLVSAGFVGAGAETSDTAPPADAPAPDAPPDAPPDAAAFMTPARLVALIQAIDADAEPFGAGVEFHIGDRPLTLVYDAAADRMRIITPIIPAESAGPALLERMMQANFDTALDARYAIGRELVWAAFIHPLSPLTDEQVISGVAQTVTLAETFGATFTSGALVYGGGDSGELYEALRDALSEALEHDI